MFSKSESILRVLRSLRFFEHVPTLHPGTTDLYRRRIVVRLRVHTIEPQQAASGIERGYVLSRVGGGAVDFPRM